MRRRQNRLGFLAVVGQIVAEDQPSHRYPSGANLHVLIGLLHVMNHLGQVVRVGGTVQPRGLQLQPTETPVVEHDRTDADAISRRYQALDVLGLGFT